MTNAVARERHAVRALVLTTNAELLLMRIRSPDSGELFWIAPGGGLEAGESSENGLRRELREELGLTEFTLGPLVWLREHTFTWAGQRIRQHEQYHIVVVERFVPVMADEAESKVLDRFHWWHVADLEHSQERLTPLSLARIVGDYLTEGPPREALTVEVLVD